MTRRERRPGAAESGRTCDEDLAELELAHTLIALHRAERAPRGVREQIESGLQARSVPRSGGASCARRMNVFMAHIAGWPGAGVVGVAALLLLTLQHRQGDEARESQTAEAGPMALAEPEATVSGVAVPGSLVWRMYGDEIGMGHCEASFSLTPSGAPHGEPLRVSWTRCDLPDELSEELRRVFSPVRGVPPLSLSARGRWARENEFEAFSVRVQP